MGSGTVIRRKGCSDNKSLPEGTCMAQEKWLHSFSGSAAWCYCFVKTCYSFITHVYASVGHGFPTDWESKTASSRAAYMAKYGNCDIYMGKVPVTFDMPLCRTVDEKGAQTINAETTGHERNSFSVGLGCSAAGEKLIPTIMFKKKTLPKEDLLEGIIMAVN